MFKEWWVWVDSNHRPHPYQSYIKYLENGIFEIHTSVSGPLGAEVYFFERGLLQGRQRRSYSFVTQIYKVKYEAE